MGENPSPSGEDFSLTIFYLCDMQHYRKTSHTVYDIKYHLVWVTKYRKKILTGELANRIRDLIREICKTNYVKYVRPMK